MTTRTNVDTNMVLEIVRAASLDALLEIAGVGQTVDERLTENTVLFGGDGALDSLSLVTLVLDIEQRVNDQFGTSIMIADEKAMSQKRSPFRTVGSLTGYVTTLLAEQLDVAG